MRRLVVLGCMLLALPALAHAAGNPVADAARKSAAAGSWTFQVSATTTLRGGGKAVMTGTGAATATRARISMRTRIQGQTVEAEGIVVRERGEHSLYVRMPGFAQLPSGKRWVRLDLSAARSQQGVDVMSLLNTPEALLLFEKGLVSVTRVGSEVVAGKPTTRYRAVVDHRRAARLVPGYAAQHALLERSFGARISRTPYDIWVGGDGRFRRVRFALETNVGRLEHTTTFLSFGGSVRISLPPASEVFSLP
ncbi:MAG: hypothetical protein RMM28_04145 [Thermoleophilia bacterium]|nr:hypothetical protein [Thermoleophilia bacterium]